MYLQHNGAIAFRQLPLSLNQTMNIDKMFGSHLQSGLASGLEKLAPCRLIGVRGRNIRRGFHGSTPEHRDGLCAVVSSSHEHLGATASDLCSVGECAN